jgi:hypothetical protein
MCRHALVVDPTTLDSESVVGDECHIVSGATNGPRHDAVFPKTEIDDLSNLLLLCRIHHKMIDDQAETYTAELLRVIKANHEKWVESKLKDKAEISPLQIRRFKSEIPTKLPVVSSGKELLNLAISSHGTYTDYSDDLNEEEIDLVGGFIQNVSDWGDVADALEPIERVRAANMLGEEIKELNAHGFFVFAAMEKQRVEGGISAPSIIKVLHLTVKRSTDPDIVTAESDATN